MLIIGPGSVGSRIAVMLRAVGTTVDGAGRHSRSAEGPIGRVVGSSSLAKIVGDHDLVVVAAALTAGTRGLISADVLTEGRPLRNVVEMRLGYVGTASLVGTSREGGIG